MLDAFRKANQSWLIKIFFAILVLSFGGLWGAGGLGDLMRGRLESRPAIVVGAKNIPAEEVADEFRRDTERLAQMFGGKLSLDQARQFGLLQRTIDQMIGRSLLDQAAAKLGIGVDDATLRQSIADTPAFQNELHVFDKNRYLALLSRAGLSERRFEDEERRDLTRSNLSLMIGEGLEVPAIETDALFGYRQERRIAETVTFQADRMPAPPAPDESDLKRYLAGHQSQFQAPEMRAITAVLIRAQDLAGDIKPSDEDIKKAYEARQGEFSTPDRREVAQLLFADQAKAQSFVDSLKNAKNGGDFAAAAKAAGVEVTDLGTVGRGDLPLKALADAAFAPDKPGVAGPVQTPLGWHVLDIRAISPGRSKTLAEVRDQIVQGLVANEANNRLYALSTKLEDAIGSGAGMDEAGAAVGVKPVRLAAIDARGNGQDGKPAGLPPELVNAAFQTGAGGTSEVTQTTDGSGYFAVHVDAVTPPAPRPFEAVRDQLAKAWEAEARDKAARKAAEDAEARLKKGESLAAVAGPFKVETTKPFLRTPDPKGGVSPLLAAEMFKAKPGESAVVAADGGTVLARLQSVLPADPKTEQVLYDKSRQQFDQAMAQDLMQSYVAALRRDMGVHVNDQAIAAQLDK